MVPLIGGFGDTQFDSYLGKLYQFDTSILKCKINSLLLEFYNSSKKVSNCNKQSELYKIVNLLAKT